MSEAAQIEFVPFPKIGRLSRLCTITEKIDGTNASIHITEDGQFRTGSRTRWITPEDDNYGFSKWAHANREQLMQLGPGTHFGEWWGSGIGRGYDLKEKRFSLFNTFRWRDGADIQRPECCGLVPVIYEGQIEILGYLVGVGQALRRLREDGSKAAPGFMRPEGIIIYHHATKTYFKKTIEKDEKPKGSNEDG